MDDSTREAFRTWRADPGDRESFNQWWHSFLRSEGYDPFEARIIASGLFYASGIVDENGNNIWIHRSTMVNMVQVMPRGALAYPNVDTASGQIQLNHVEPFLIATTPVGAAEWSTITGDSSAGVGDDASVTWNRAAGWCEQVKLRLPSHAMWVVAREAGLITRRNSGPEFLQDFHWALTDNKTRLPQNPFIAIGDTTYSSPLWVSGSPADLVFNDFLMAQVVEKDFLEVEKRISAFGLNVGIEAPPELVTYHDRSGNPRLIMERASPFPGGPPPSGATPQTHQPPISTGPPSPSPMEDPEFSGEMSPEALLGSDGFDLSGGETGLPVFFDDTIEIDRALFAREYQAEFPPFVYRGRSTISHHRETNGYRIAEVHGRRGRPKIRPVWR